MNNKARIVSEVEKEICLTSGTDYVLKHRIVERKLRMLPEMLIVQGRIYYDYTDIIHRAFETGQMAYIRKKVNT